MTQATSQNKDKDFTLQSARNFHFVFPKQGRLSEAFNVIAEIAGFYVSREKSRHSFGVCQDVKGQIPPFSASIKKPGVMFRKLSEGRADMAIIGLDKYIEESCRAKASGEAVNIRISASFNCAACSMYVAAAPQTQINTPQDLRGKRIATAYPYSLAAWLEAQGVQDFTIITCDGDTEDEIRDGSADAIFEIVDSGQSLIDNNLERKILAYNVQAVLVERTSMKSESAASISNAVRERLIEASAQSIKSRPNNEMTMKDSEAIEPAFMSPSAI